VPRFCASFVALSIVPIAALLSTAAVSEHRGTTCFPTSPAQNQDSPSFNGAFGRPRPRNACRHYSHFCPSRGSWLFSVRISQKGDPRGPHSQPKCVSRTCRSRSVERPLSSAWPTQVSMLLLLGHLGTTSFGAPSCRSAPVHAFASPDQPSRNVYAQASTPSLFATNARHQCSPSRTRFSCLHASANDALAIMTLLIFAALAAFRSAKCMLRPRSRQVMQ
jgi:hypothetical protein